MNNTYSTVTAQEAVKMIRSGDHIHLSSVAAAPQCLIKALCERGEKGELENVTIHHLHTDGPAPYTDPKFEGIFHHKAFFVGKNVRKSIQDGFADYVAVFLYDTQKLYRENYIPCDVVLISITKPDKHGYVSLGPCCDATLAAIEKAHLVIAAVNPNLPRTFGDSMIPMNAIDVFVEDDTPLILSPSVKPDEVQMQIGRHVAELVDDGACLQMGIGAIPNAVLSQLTYHKDLGIHTEMFSDGVVKLAEKGVITGLKKKLDKGKIVSTFVDGGKEVYDFIDDNPEVMLRDVSYTNDPFIISQQPKMTSINSVLEIDITGHTCADSIGTKFFSGVGGQIDFITGASRADKGKTIIAMPSVTKDGKSKIVPVLSPGAGCGTPRSQIHWIATEWGAVEVFGKTLQERAKRLISIAHPKHRESLEKAAYERYGEHYKFID